MIRKFATVPACRVVLTLILLTILAGATTVLAQQTPAETPAQQTPAQQPSAEPSAQQQPDQQPSSTQEASPEEIGLGRKPKVKDYKNWTFNVGGGASLTDGTTKVFVRGGGPVAAGGVARNYSKYFGFRLDFQFDNLPLRTSALELAQAPGATSHVYSLMLDPIINVPVSKLWGGYILAGLGYFHRSGKLELRPRFRDRLQWLLYLVGELPQFQPALEQNF